MNNKVIIDGCNVAECEFYQIEANELYPKVQYCGSMRNTFCENEPNCYFKQLQRLKSEFAEVLDVKCGTIAALKVENDELKKLTGVYSTRKIKALESENDELKKLLEEQGKIIDCKTGTIQSLAKIRDDLKAKLNKIKNLANERIFLCTDCEGNLKTGKCDEPCTAYYIKKELTP